IRKEVTRVSIASHEPQRLPFPATADQDGRMRLLHGLGRIERPLESIMLADIGFVITSPHLVRNLKRLLEALKALCQRRGGGANAPVLPPLPGGTYTEVSTPIREHV